MDSTMISTMAVIALAFLGGWIQINKRLAILENQQKNDHEILMKREKSNEKVGNDILDIKEEIIQLRSDLKMKQNRKFKEE